MYFTSGPLLFLELVLRKRVDRAKALGEAGDRGASAVEWVIITSVLVAIVAVVGTLLYTKLQTAATNINVDPPVKAP